MTSNKSMISGVVLALLASTSAIAQAQEGAGSAGNDASSSGQLQDIVVTAQRREERLQDVPVSVSVIGGNALENLGVTDVTSLGKVSSSVNLNVGNGPVLTFIRGIGNTTSAAGNEGSAAIYIDGIYVARPLSSMFNFNSIERVEVLKGPQGTLFGRNSSAGLINIVTRTPTSESKMEASIGYANYETVDVNTYVSTGLGQVGAIDVAAFYHNQNEGWGRNVVTGEDIGLNYRYGGRSKLVLDLADTTKVTITADYLKARRDHLLGNPLRGETVGNSRGAGGYPPTIYQPLSFYDQRAERVGSVSEQSYGFSARIDHELSFADFASITGYRKSKNFLTYDADNTPVPAFYVQLDNRSKQFSEELQLLSKTGSAVKWVVGLFYLKADDGYYPTSFQGTDFGPGVNVNLFGTAKVKSYAAFGQATYEILPKLSLTAGARYTIDKASVFGYTDATSVGPDPLDGSQGGVPFPGARSADVIGAKTFKKLTWRGALDYKMTDDVLLFASISRGYKAGVFETLPANSVPIRPETVDAYEVGFKSELFNRRLRINGALFWNDVKDPQVSFIRATFVSLANAESARSRGAEIEFELAATDHLHLRFGGTYLDSTFRSFANAPFNAGNGDLVNGIVPGCSTPATVNLDTANGGNVDFCQGDASGKRLPRAPKFTFNTGFDFNIPVGESNEIQINANLAYNDGFFWEPQNTLGQEAFVLVDGQIAYAINDGQLRMRVWGRNLTDKKYYDNAFINASASGSFGQVAAPRTYGIALDMKF